MRYFDRSVVLWMAAICVLLLTAQAEAVTQIITRNVLQDTNNRPFFLPANYDPGTITNANGYSGTATAGADSTSTVTGVNLGVGGNGTNALPMGVVFNFGVQFTVTTTDSGHVLTDTGDTGLGVNSGGSDTHATNFSAGEKLFFSDITLTGPPLYDPLGLLQPGATVNVDWRVLRSSAGAGTFSTGDSMTTSTDPDGTENVQVFTAGQINNGFAMGAINPPKSPLYLNMTSGDWILKGIGYQVELNYELAPAPPLRRTFNFGTNFHPTYTGQTTHQLADNTQSDTNINFSALGNEGVLDVNSLGVGVNSIEDDHLTVNEQRFTNGTLATPEAIHFSFNKDVALESLTLGNVELNDTEGVVLSFVSGTNPFTGLTGYADEYSLNESETSLTFIGTLGASETPYPVTYGMNGQDPLMIEAGTVLSLTANPQNGSGFLLDMMTVHLLSEPGLDGDYNDDVVVDAADYVVWRKTNIGGDQGYLDWRANFGNSNLGSGANSGNSLGAVPEPASFLLALAGLLIVGGSCRRQR